MSAARGAAAPPPVRLEPRPWMTADETRAVVAALSAAGATVRFVGGCVRDALIGRPVKDIDIATPDPPCRVIELLEAADIEAVPTGRGHGTVTAVVPPRRFEVTTLRIDAETFGRRARVEFSEDWDADAARRDFTINAIYCGADGEVFDPVGGIADLNAGVVRFVGDPDKRIREDVLRILRFFRFTAFYGAPPPDPDGLMACRAHTGALAALSGERVAGELLRLLESRDAAAILRVMRDGGVLRPVLPELSPSGIARVGRLIAVDSDDPDPLRRLMAGLGTDGPGAARTVAGRWRLPNAQRDRMAAAAAHADGMTGTLDARGRRRLLYRLGRETFTDLAYLGWSREPERKNAWRRHLRAAREWTAPALPVGGADVLALEAPPGPAVGRTLGEVERWWIDGDFRADREACLRKLRQVVKAGPTPPSDTAALAGEREHDSGVARPVSWFRQTRRS